MGPFLSGQNQIEALLQFGKAAVRPPLDDAAARHRELPQARRKEIHVVASASVPPGAKEFYGTKLGFIEGRSSKQWQDYNMFGHQLVVHQVTKDYRGVDFFNPVDADDVPVPHFGVALTVDEFHALSERVQGLNIKFIVEPHLRFAGRKGEQWTMFFKDPSGNNLEFKAMTNPDNLFAKYVEE